MPDHRPPGYGELLQEARELGRADGRFAAAFEPGRPPTGRPERCLGRTPAEFARLLWQGRRGTPPIGLEVNAPLWYATGFREGWVAGRVQRTTAFESPRSHRTLD